jgi:hypothetical protein
MKQLEWFRAELDKINHTRNRNEIKWFLDIGQLILDMVARKDSSTIINAGLTLANAMCMDAEGISKLQIYASAMFAGRLSKNPASDSKGPFAKGTRERVISLGMPLRVAEKAAYWSAERMGDALELREKCGNWADVYTRWVMPRGGVHHTHKPEKFVHRANSIHAGTEENVNMLTLKHRGEWDAEKVENLLRHLATAVPDFPSILRTALHAAGISLDTLK